jgi:hypothetical protein
MEPEERGRKEDGRGGEDVYWLLTGEKEESASASKEEEKESNTLLAVRGTETSNRRRDLTLVSALSETLVLLLIDHLLVRRILVLLLELPNEGNEVLDGFAGDLVVHDDTVRTEGETAGLGSLGEVGDGETESEGVEPEHVGLC